MFGIFWVDLVDLKRLQHRHLLTLQVPRQLQIQVVSGKIVEKIKITVIVTGPRFGTENLRAVSGSGRAPTLEARCLAH